MELITDRTQADVLLGTPKGAYSPEDLNRVERAVQELALLAMQVDVILSPEVKTDWRIPEAFSGDSWPVSSQMERYLGNVRLICDGLQLDSLLPDGMESLNWEGANRIEQALAQAYKQIQSVLQTFQYSGELYAGEEIGI